MDNIFFEQLAKYYRHENDLSNITVALCNSSDIFREIFVHFFFPEIRIENIKEISREIWDVNGMGSRVDIHITLDNDEIFIVEVKKGDRNHTSDNMRFLLILIRVILVTLPTTIAQRGKH